MSPRILNKKFDAITPNTVYIGRPSKWGNPFSHLHTSLANFKVVSRDAAVDAYEYWLHNQHPELIVQAKQELRGKDLMCWCAPNRCHGEILIRIANEED